MRFHNKLINVQAQRGELAGDTFIERYINIKFLNYFDVSLGEN